MQSARFDAIVIALATATSRRQVVRSALSSAVMSLGVIQARRSARAQAGGVALGGFCNGSADCAQQQGCDLAASVVCADNGMAPDGPRNCCLNEGGYCADDAHCCAGLVCTGGGGEGCGAGLCAYPGNTRILPGRPCVAVEDCNQLGGTTDCASNGDPNDPGLVCCRTIGGACVTDRDCCASLFCSDGICGGGALPPGTRCTEARQCDQSAGVTDCADNGISTDGSLHCCRYAGGACTADNHSAGCCHGLLCVNDVCAA
jgi:hypothetical protein